MVLHHYRIVQDSGVQQLQVKFGNDDGIISLTGELNIGVGMTFSTKALKDKFEFNATISPLSYNPKTVINKEVSETQHGLKRGHQVAQFIRFERGTYMELGDML